MANNVVNKYLCLITAFQRYGKITLKELSDKWSKNQTKGKKNVANALINFLFLQNKKMFNDMQKINFQIKVVIAVFTAMFCQLVSVNAQTDSVNVKHYDINLNVDNIISKGHTGNTYILFDLITDDNHEVQFNLLNQSIDSVYTGNTSVNMPAQKTQFTYDGKKVRFQIPQYTVKENYFAIVYYHGASTVEKNASAWGGLHYDNDIIYSMGVAFADYPHTYARSWFVCNDNFTDKATYNINISVDKDKEAFCSGKFIEKEEYESFDTYKYSLEQEVSPYLVAMTIGKFYTYTKTIHSETYNYDIPLIVKYIYPQDSANVVHNFTGIEKAFNELEKHFGKFRFNRVGYCVTPKGSMEHVDNISLARGVIIDISIDAVSNIVHELGHSWFGNLCTCETAEDMWLNEGWTTYTTRLSLEAIYGEEKTKDYWRSKHRWVLEKLPSQEGILPVTPVDSTLTYSSTVYEKGSMVAKTLQGYFGDEIFFDAVKAMLDSFEFKNYNSYQVRDFLASYTQDNNFAEFFNNLVFEDHQINYDMYKDAEGECKFKFNYPEYENVLNVPAVYYNNVAYADLNETLMTLNTDNIIDLDTISLFKSADTYFQVKVTNIQTPKKLRSTLHWTGANDAALPYGVEKISSMHYWTIQCGDLDGLDCEFKFYFTLSANTTSFDSSLVHSYFGKDSIILLYRKDITQDWQAIPFTIPDRTTGFLSTSFTQAGDYAMARGDKQKVSLLQVNETECNIKIYPNPSDNLINIECKDWNKTTVKVFSQEGKLIDTFKLKKNNSVYKFKNKGVFVLKFENPNTNISKTVVIP